MARKQLDLEAKSNVSSEESRVAHVPFTGRAVRETILNA